MPRDLIQFEAFPRGACGDTGLPLAWRFEEQGFGAWEHVAGWRDGWSHAWLEGDGKCGQAGVIVDVTADQFPDADADVVVTDDPSWHRQFTRQVRDRAVPADEDALAPAYRRLQAAI